MIGDSAMGPTAWSSLAGPATRRSYRWMLLILALAVLGSANSAIASSGEDNQHGKQWIGTWATAAQPAMPGTPESFRNQSLRLIVHTSAGGKKIRIKIS